jgi:hypothetical protein
MAKLRPGASVWRPPEEQGACGNRIPRAEQVSREAAGRAWGVSLAAHLQGPSCAQRPRSAHALLLGADPPTLTAYPTNRENGSPRTGAHPRCANPSSAPRDTHISTHTRVNEPIARANPHRVNNILARWLPRTPHTPANAHPGTRRATHTHSPS